MIASYREQIERLRARIEETDASQLHILDLQKDGTYLDTATKAVYKNWEEVEEKLSGTVIIDDIPDDEEINEGVRMIENN